MVPEKNLKATVLRSILFECYQKILSSYPFEATPFFYYRSVLGECIPS